MKKFKIKKAISMKGFILELGENFSAKMKKRLLDLEVRCVLTRKEDVNILDLKHVEHTKFGCLTEGNPIDSQKEYSYGQFVIQDGSLYYSEDAEVNELTMEAPVVDRIYNSLTSEIVVLESGSRGKKIDDSNIDFVVDSLLAECPQISQEYYNIISKYCAVDGFKPSRTKS